MRSHHNHLRGEHPPLTLRVERGTGDGRGVCRQDGKVIFVAGCLTGELVVAKLLRRHRKRDEATTVEVLEPAHDRVAPICSAYGRCGGCALQHQTTAGQVADKQARALENLQRIGSVTPLEVLPALTGPAWHYRARARLGVKWVAKKGVVLVGFREKLAPLITDTLECPVLDIRIHRLLPALRALIAELSVRARLPQIEVACSEGATALVVRHLDPLSDADLNLLLAFGRQHAIDFYLQSRGLDSVIPLPGHRSAELYYDLDDFDVRVRFGPTDFTQVNPAVNRALVCQAVALLAPQAGEQVADLFCGVGNFSLALARRGAQVEGAEAEPALVQRAEHNARLNNLPNARFRRIDLFDPSQVAAVASRLPGKVLIDPPRVGAREICESLVGTQTSPRQLLYVSCNPATLARDAGILVHNAGFQLRRFGLVDMFPHTAHAEAMALFER